MSIPQSKATLEPQQIRILKFLLGAGEPQELGEIASQLGQPKTEVQYHCDTLWAKGLLEVGAHFTQPQAQLAVLSFSLTPRGKETAALHLAGELATATETPLCRATL